LVECGFLSNSAEARKVRSPFYRQRLADAIVRGIIKSSR
jgi:N-acetylmuramoyl-L-alanine amidase